MEKIFVDVKEMFYFKDFINNVIFICVYIKGNYVCIFNVRRLEDWIIYVNVWMNNVVWIVVFFCIYGIGCCLFYYIFLDELDFFLM